MMAKKMWDNIDGKDKMNFIKQITEDAKSLLMFQELNLNIFEIWYRRVVLWV